MKTGFKLSHRLARGFWMVGAAVTLAACAGESLTDPSDPGTSTKPVSTISISPQTANVDLNGTTQLTVVLRDENGTALSGRAITWTTTAASIATVTSAGVVAGADTGTATIKASSEGKS
ncbi:MAG TPA: Ig-like domain-containing protein, partial [Gemmatimonadales bacterium]|nr:Ig-like domain-containing protein [Gemmatimonadales bacterium]